MKFLRFLSSLLISLSLIYFLNNRGSDLPLLKSHPSLRSLPALGDFLNPFTGFWMNAEPSRIPQDIRLDLSNLQDKVEVVLDDRLIPHIFAKNDHDLYFAQGYITAKYRLWQMEFQTHYAAGRLSEIVGKDAKALEHDKLQRRIGMVYAAENAIKAMNQDETSKLVMQAYADGINAYIQQLKPRDYPIEYKLLGYAPEPWSPLKSALLQKYMAQDLSYRGDDLQMTNILNKYGKDVIKELFSGYPPSQDPIIPPQTPFDFKKLPIPKIPKQTTAPLPLLEQAGGDAEKEESRKGIGSNNWAISAEKSATGYPILANDPHLGLNLPSIWFELQLIAPKINVYGASLPGAPGVVIGFNQDVSWGVTNVESDVQDWYLIKFKDESRKEYKYGKGWKPTTTRIEKIKIRGGETIVDTIYFTHYGPIVAQTHEAKFAKNNAVPLNCALRWTAHDVSNDLITFYKLNRARNYEDYRDALTFYACPAQNFVFADNQKNIAITPNGKFPLKWKEQGKFVLDGSNPDHEWQGWIPYNQNPHVKNPERGFVSSANQFPADTTYPYYLHWEFATFERGKRINERLATMQNATRDSLRSVQNDNLNIFARELLPMMLKQLNINALNAEEKLALKELERWNYQHLTNKIAPTLFKDWWLKTTDAIWKDDFGDQVDGMRYPGADKTRDMIIAYDSTNYAKWFDNRSTPQKESISDILTSSFQLTVKTLTEKFGKMGDKWLWKSYRTTSVQHLARIPAFSAKEIISNGDNRTVNAVGPRNGPSWRMVVSLGVNPKALCIYPGGQSGNPGSHYYTNFIPQWQKGELAEALYFKTPTDVSKRIIGRVRLNKP